MVMTAYFGAFLHKNNFCICNSVCYQCCMSYILINILLSYGIYRLNFLAVSVEVCMGSYSRDYLHILSEKSNFF